MTKIKSTRNWPYGKSFCHTHKSEVVERETVMLDLWKVAIRVLERQVDQGKTPSQISRELKVQPSTITRWLNAERGQSRPDVKYLQKIFYTYNVDIQEVLMEALPKKESGLLIAALEMDAVTLIKAAEVLLRGDLKAKKLVDEINFLANEPPPAANNESKPH
jgi:transcriptional regulator with XRE-family HTH domain